MFWILLWWRFFSRTTHNLTSLPRKTTELWDNLMKLGPFKTILADSGKEFLELLPSLLSSSNCPCGALSGIWQRNRCPHIFFILLREELCCCRHSCGLSIQQGWAYSDLIECWILLSRKICVKISLAEHHPTALILPSISAYLCIWGSLQCYSNARNLARVTELLEKQTQVHVCLCNETWNISIIVHGKASRRGGCRTYARTGELVTFTE